MAGSEVADRPAPPWQGTHCLFRHSLDTPPSRLRSMTLLWACYFDFLLSSFSAAQLGGRFPKHAVPEVAEGDRYGHGHREAEHKYVSAEQQGV